MSKLKPQPVQKTISPVFNELTTKLWWSYKVWTPSELEILSNFLIQNSKDFQLTADFYDNMKYLNKIMGLYHHPFLNFPIKKSALAKAESSLINLQPVIPIIPKEEKKGQSIDTKTINTINQQSQPIMPVLDPESETVIIKNYQIDLVTLKLLQFCWSLSKVSVLKLTHNKLDIESEKTLWELISIPTIKMQKLFYDWNIIRSYDSFTKIFLNPSLEFLTLRACEIDDSAIKILYETLKQNTTLKFLDLYHNKITKEGMLVLEKLLETPSNIEFYGLAKNLINDWDDVATFFTKIGRIPITPEEAEIHKQKEKDRDAIVQKNLKNKSNKKYVEEPVPVLDPLAQLADGSWALLKNIKVKTINLALNGISDKYLDQVEKVLKNSDEALVLILSESKFDDKSKDYLRSRYPSKIHF